MVMTEPGEGLKEVSGPPEDTLRQIHRDLLTSLAILNIQPSRPSDDRFAANFIGVTGDFLITFGGVLLGFASYSK